MAERKQSGLAHVYTEWVPETDVGVVPDNPTFRPFSDNVRTVFDGEPDAGTEAQRGLGTRDPRGFFNGPEEHEFTFVYDLQNWYVDGVGDTVDPAGDILNDTADNDVGATHSVVSCERHVEGGNDGGGRRIYTVGKGGYVAELTVPFETDTGLPVEQELVYRFEKVREYDFSQPAGAAILGVASTDAGDTTQTVTLEADNGNTEDLTLSGTTFVTTTTEFGSITAVELSAETAGNVVVSTSDGATAPAAAVDLATIYGTDAYGGAEGDLGVPAVGAGSHSGVIGTDYIRFTEDTLHYAGEGEIAPEVMSGELTIDNGVDATGQANTLRQSIDVGQRETTLTASLAGPKPTFDQMTDYLQEVAHDVEWIPNTGAGNSLVLEDARLITPGNIARETDAAKLVLEAEWQAEGTTLT